jgi:hypothetical protein
MKVVIKKFKRLENLELKVPEKETELKQNY